MEQEEFIHAILNSTNGMAHVNPSDDLLSKIELRISEKSVVPMKTLWWVAASIVVLISINVVVLATKSTLSSSTSSELEQSIHKSNQLY
jgi:hypothetical protein